MSTVDFAYCELVFLLNCSIRKNSIPRNEVNILKYELN